MLEDQQKDHHGSLRPRLQVRIWSEDPTTIHSTTLGSSNTGNTSVGATDKENIVQPNVFNRGTNSKHSGTSPCIPFWFFENLPPTLQWVPEHCNCSKWKPAVRSALAAWFSLLLFLIPTTQNVMGQVRFFSCFCPLLELDPTWNSQGSFLIIISKLLKDMFRYIRRAN